MKKYIVPDYAGKVIDKIVPYINWPYPSAKLDLIIVVNRLVLGGEVPDAGWGEAKVKLC